MILNTKEVKTLLKDGKVSVSRRLKHKPHPDCPYYNTKGVAVGCPWGRKGEIAEVQEAWGTDYLGRTATVRGQTVPVAEFVYKADGRKLSECGYGWHAAKDMPPQAVRLRVKITRVYIKEEKWVLDAARID
jgi:hypothetical protein